VDEYEALRLGFGHTGVEGLVRLLEHQRIVPRIGAEHMLLDVQAEQGLRVLFDVQQRSVVVGPCEVGLDLGYRNLENLAAAQILEAQGELPPAHGILAERKPLAARRDFERADAVVVVPIALLIGVD
jgi:hypothetical protein